MKSCFARDSYRCVRCGSGKVGGRKLHAHHIRPWSVCPEKRMSLDNVTTLCDVCHLWVHSTENARGEFLAA